MILRFIADLLGVLGQFVEHLYSRTPYRPRSNTPTDLRIREQAGTIGRSIRIPALVRLLTTTASCGGRVLRTGPRSRQLFPRAHGPTLEATPPSHLRRRSRRHRRRYCDVNSRATVKSKMAANAITNAIKM